MIDFKNYRRVELRDVAMWERAKKGKTYPAGCSTLQVSATKGLIEYLHGPREVEDKFVVITPNSDIVPFYFNVVLKKNIDEFLYAYKSGLNIQFSDVGHFPIELHNHETQEQIAKMVAQMDGAIEQEERTIEIGQSMKQNFLSEMMI